MCGDDMERRQRPAVDKICVGVYCVRCPNSAFTVAVVQIRYF